MTREFTYIERYLRDVTAMPVLSPDEEYRAGFRALSEDNAPEEAWYHFRRAADRLHQGAFLHLAKLSNSGFGMNASPSQTYLWASLAQRGDDSALRNSAGILLSEVKAHLSTQQIHDLDRELP
jgi:TPR repeat protein